MCVQLNANAYIFIFARLPPFSPIFSKIGKVQPKVDFYTLKSPKLALIALPRYLNSIFLISDLCTMPTPSTADKRHIQKAI